MERRNNAIEIYEKRIVKKNLRKELDTVRDNKKQRKQQMIMPNQTKYQRKFVKYITHQKLFPTFSHRRDIENLN